MPRKAASYQRWKTRPDRPKKEERPTASQRGYGWRWTKYRRVFLSRPENALCVRCLEAGRTESATQVDHVVPVTSADDAGFWAAGNHQGLCASCHSRKTNTEDVGRGRAGRNWRRRG